MNFGSNDKLSYKRIKKPQQMILYLHTSASIHIHKLHITPHLLLEKSNIQYMYEKIQGIT